MLDRLEQYDAYAVPLDRIYYDADFNCRGEFTLESVMDLAENIRLRGKGVELKGLDFPVVVQPITDMADKQPAGFDYRLLAGHRRFQAIKTFLKWHSIPAMIREGLSDREARMLNFVENLERKDLNILEEARALGRLYPDGVPLRVAAKEIKRPTRWIHARLRLLTLPEEVQRLAATGLLAATNMETLADLKSPEAQIEAARKIVELRRERGKSASMKRLNPKYRRKFRPRPTKPEINKMVAKMLGRGIEGLGPRMGAWCAGYISDAEIVEDIRNAALSNSAVVDVSDGGTT